MADMKGTASEVRIVDRERALSLLEGTRPQDRVFWVGAGVDRDEPRSLPLASDLVDFLIDFMMREDRAGAFREQWRRCSEIVYGEARSPRMETMIDAIKLFEANLRPGESTGLRYSALEGLRFFDEAPDNGNVDLLAKAVLAGSAVVTTNYSEAIEKAAGRLDPGYCYEAVRDGDFPTFCTSRPTDGRFGSVYHIHGTAASPDTLGITLPLISRRFPQWFQGLLRGLLGDGSKLFVFAGYSGSDDYDVNRFFRECADGRRAGGGARGLYLRHGPASAKVSPGEGKALLPFSEKLVCQAGLCDLLGPSGPVPPCGGFDWRSSFSSLASWPGDAAEKEELEALAALVFSDYFGLDLSGGGLVGARTLDGLRRRLGEGCEWYLDYYAIRYADVAGDRELLETLRPRVSGRPLLMRAYVVACGEPERAGEFYPRIPELRENVEAALSGGGPIGWHETSAPINHYAIDFLRMAAGCRGDSAATARLAREWAPGLAVLLECADGMKALPYDMVDSLRQVVTAARSAAIARSLVCAGPEAEEEALRDIDLALGIYEDISSVSGYALTAVAKGIVMMLWDPDGAEDEARAAAAKGRAAAEAAGNSHALARIGQVEGLVDPAACRLLKSSLACAPGERAAR